MQRIQLDLTSHPAKNLVKEKVRLSKIEIIKEAKTGEEQISLDFNSIQTETKERLEHRGSIVLAPGYRHIN